MGQPLFIVLHFYATRCIFIRVTDLKERRQRTIVELIRGQTLSNQEQLAERLASLGYAATQATISRDLEQIGALKVRRNGQLSYALRDEVRSGPNPRLAAVFRDWVRSVEPASNLVVIRTPPGSAHLVGVALDNSDLHEIVGTICGDDTVFVACRGSADAQALAAKLSGELH
jgi:transcriptional regulator of arginine metabolism